MKIRLTRDVPVEPKHGMTKGRVLEVVRSTHPNGKGRPWVRGDAGEEVLIQPHEYEEVDEND